MLAGEMTLEVLAVEVNPQVNGPLPEIRPIETNWGRGERDGERATSGSHPEQIGSNLRTGTTGSGWGGRMWPGCRWHWPGRWLELVREWAGARS